MARPAVRPAGRQVRVFGAQSTSGVPAARLSPKWPGFVREFLERRIAARRARRRRSGPSGPVPAAGRFLAVVAWARTKSDLVWDRSKPAWAAPALGVARLTLEAERASLRAAA
ncbi:MAG TPA: hypothetical protein VJN43_07510 [Bryobacteraceae bacterium]|nr:hypothetical protein [Bryobacteraceae bacterium]